MFSSKSINYRDKQKFYVELGAEIRAMLDTAWFTNLANASACMMEHIPDLNWAGFYVAEGRELILGPFQGRSACLRIPFGKGVCGTAAANGKSVAVDDVEKFPGHIACDSHSRSEIVVPLLNQKRTFGVLDLDSPSLNRFDAADRAGLETIARILTERTRWPASFL